MQVPHLPEYHTRSRVVARPGTARRGVLCPTHLENGPKRWRTLTAHHGRPDIATERVGTAHESLAVTPRCIDKAQRLVPSAYEDGMKKSLSIGNLLRQQCLVRTQQRRVLARPFGCRPPLRCAHYQSVSRRAAQLFAEEVLTRQDDPTRCSLI